MAFPLASVYECAVFDGEVWISVKNSLKYFTEGPFDKNRYYKKKSPSIQDKLEPNPPKAIYRYGLQLRDNYTQYFPGHCFESPH